MATDEDHTESCAVCQTKGRLVAEQTVKALLTHAALRRFEHGVYRFCADTGCAVVYFDDAGHTFKEEDVTVPVWQKHPPGARLLCYCFGETETDIHVEIARDGQSGAVERVRHHIAAGRCACEVRNPRGSCCLGDVIDAVKGMTRDA